MSSACELALPETEHQEGTRKRPCHTPVLKPVLTNWLQSSCRYLTDCWNCVKSSCFMCSTIILVPKKPSITRLNDFLLVTLTSMVTKSFKKSHWWPTWRRSQNICWTPWSCLAGKQVSEGWIQHGTALYNPIPWLFLDPVCGLLHNVQHYHPRNPAFQTFLAYSIIHYLQLDYQLPGKQETAGVSELSNFRNIDTQHWCSSRMCIFSSTLLYLHQWQHL